MDNGGGASQDDENIDAAWQYVAFAFYTSVSSSLFVLVAFVIHDTWTQSLWARRAGVEQASDLLLTRVRASP